MSPEVSLYRIQCPGCDKRLKIPSTKRKPFACPKCGMKLALSLPERENAKPISDPRVETSGQPVSSRPSQQPFGSPPIPRDLLPPHESRAALSYSAGLTTRANQTSTKKKNKARPPGQSLTGWLISIVVYVIAMVGLALLAADDQKNMSVPTNAMLVQLQGKPSDFKRETYANRRGIYQRCEFQVGGRKIKFKSGQIPNDQFDRVCDLIQGCDTTSVLVHKDEHHFNRTVPFWELRVDESVVLSKTSMQGEHENERWWLVRTPYILIIGTTICYALGICRVLFLRWNA